jgi:hypothetical protein
MKFTYFLFLALIFTSCNLIRILQMSEPNDESTIEVNRYLKKYKYDYSLFADDSKSWMQKTKMYGINNDTTKYSYVQLRIYNRDGSLYSAFSQCMGDFNKRDFVDSFPLKRNDYPFINEQLKLKNEMDLLDLSSERKEQILSRSGNYKFTYVVYYAIWTSYLSKHVLKEVSKIKSKNPNDVMVVLVNLARDKN